MRLRSLCAVLASIALLAATVPAAEAGQTNGAKRFVSVAQTKADNGNSCAIAGDKCVPSPTPGKPKGTTRTKAGSLFNAAGKDMVYCLPPTC